MAIIVFPVIILSIENDSTSPGGCTLNCLQRPDWSPKETRYRKVGNGGDGAKLKPVLPISTHSK